MTYVLATGFHKRTTGLEIKKELEYNILKKTGKQYMITVEEEPCEHPHYNNFRISCFCDKSEVFMDSTIWPEKIRATWYGKDLRAKMDQLKQNKS